MGRLRNRWCERFQARISLLHLRWLISRKTEVNVHLVNGFGETERMQVILMWFAIAFLYCISSVFSFCCHLHVVELYSWINKVHFKLLLSAEKKWKLKGKRWMSGIMLKECLSLAFVSLSATVFQINVRVFCCFLKVKWRLCSLFIRQPGELLQWGLLMGYFSVRLIK